MSHNRRSEPMAAPAAVQPPAAAADAIDGKHTVASADLWLSMRLDALRAIAKNTKIVVTGKSREEIAALFVSQSVRTDCSRAGEGDSTVGLPMRLEQKFFLAGEREKRKFDQLSGPLDEQKKKPDAPNKPDVKKPDDPVPKQDAPVPKPDPKPVRVLVRLERLTD